MTTQDTGITRSPWTLELSHRDFRALAGRHGWLTGDRYDFDLIAEVLELSEPTVRRVLNAEQRPATTFLGGLHYATGDSFRYRQVFRSVRASDPIGKE
jgi:hypothetical protein